MTITAEVGTSEVQQSTAYLAGVVRNAAWDNRLEPCNDEDVARMRASGETVDKHLAADQPIYGLTRGFGPFVLYDAESELEQGSSLITHLGTGQGRPLDPDVVRLVLYLRLTSMRRGFSAVSPDFWQTLADLYNGGFTPWIQRDGTVSASGDLQPLAAAALAFTGIGDAWVRDGDGWAVRPAREVLGTLGVEPFEWPVREALAFVNGTGVGLAVSILNQQSAVRLVRAAAVLTGRIATLLGANPEHYAAGHAHARRQSGQLTTARWISRELPEDHARDPRRPLQEPYSLRCAPQVLGAVLDQLLAAGDVLAREASGSTDNPITFEDQVLHGGNFHAMPVGLSSDQIGLALHTATYLAERQINLLLTPATNGNLPMMLTPRAGRGCGLAGVQISATSFVSRIRQLVYPSSLTMLPTNGWNQDHVPMALNGANGVGDALELAWLAIGSLALCVAQLQVMVENPAPATGVWAELVEISPPLAADRPMGAEVRSARDLFDRHAASLLAEDGMA
jgi:histidine ammonia-lyase